MIIKLARIDDRLIHGQVATVWTKETGVNRIIVVSDEVAADTVRKTLLTQVAPPGVKAHVVDVSKALTLVVWHSVKENKWLQMQFLLMTLISQHSKHCMIKELN